MPYINLRSGRSVGSRDSVIRSRREQRPREDCHTSPPQDYPTFLTYLDFMANLTSFSQWLVFSFLLPAAVHVPDTSVTRYVGYRSRDLDAASSSRTACHQNDTPKSIQSPLTPIIFYHVLIFLTFSFSVTGRSLHSPTINRKKKVKKEKSEWGNVTVRTKYIFAQCTEAMETVVVSLPNSVECKENS